MFIPNPSTRISFRRRLFALVALGLMVAGTRVEAQGLALSVTASTNLVVVSNSVTYTINMTNLTGGALPAFVTNSFPATAQLLGASITLGTGTTVTNANGFSFTITLGSFAPAQMTVTAAPTQVGLFTNTITVFVLSVTNAIANVVTEVTNTPTTQADLAVTITGPSSTVFANDWMTYGVSVTNLGPNTATSVFLTNTLPAGVGFKSLWPSNQTYNVLGSNVVLSLGALTNGGSTNFVLTVQPTNAGVLPFMSFVGSSVTDPNPANNVASNNIIVTNYFAELVAVTNSAQRTNFQNGYIEQSILVSNYGTNAAAAARVVVTGLSNRLVNAFGTNNGNPFVVYAHSLDTNQSVNLLLQYASRISFPFTNSQLHAYAVSMPDLTPPPATATSTNINIRQVSLTNGNVLVEFSSTLGRTYTVVYSDNVLFSNAMMAVPSVVAPANRTQWIDYGPPATVSAFTNTSARYYRVFLNP
jgi:uncharacterized repeat protein (TIGR01451 family)